LVELRFACFFFHASFFFFFFLSFLSSITSEKEPTVEEYLLMCANKTGGLARMSAKFSALLSGATAEQVEKIGQFAESIGNAIQIQDDQLNLDTSAVSAGKGGVGEDIHEGKRSLMVIHMLQHATPQDAQRLQHLLSLKTNDSALINEAIELLHRYGSFDFARRKAQELVDEAWREVEPFLHDGEAKQRLKGLANFLVARSK
jgi:geranylgeranyl diphosphate synthase type 3/geranylgeranyl diphosphate synthase type I